PIPISNEYHDVRVQPLKTKDSTLMAVFSTNASINNMHELALYNSKGEKLKSRKFEFDYFNKPNLLSNSAPDFENIYIFDQDGYIHIFDSDLELVEKKKLVESEKRENIVYAGYDINGDGKKELIYIYYNGLIVFEDGLNKVLEIDMEYPGFGKFSSFEQDDKQMIHFEIKNNLWYLVSIEDSKFYKIRYLIYFAYFLLLYGILYGIKYVWLRKLKIDNIKLNKIIEERTLEIHHQNLKLKDDAEFKEALSSMLVHDLKTPLQSIITFSKNDSEFNKKRLEAYSNQMLSLVLNILDVQKYENTKIELNLKENYIQNCAKFAIDKVEILAKQKGIIIINNIKPELYPKFDFEIIERVFINLLSNAIKHSPLNSSIEIYSEQVVIKEKIFCKINIKDNGEGIKKELQKSIFDLSLNSGKQLIWIATSMLIIIVILTVDFRFYDSFSFIIYGIVIFLLIIVLFAGIKVAGSTSWFSIGGFRVQPSEFAKFATALALAKYMSKVNFKLTKFNDLFITACIIAIPPILIIVQGDTGTALVFGAFVIVLYREGLNPTIIVIGLIAIALFVLTLIFDQITLIIAITAVGALIIIFGKKNWKRILTVVAGMMIVIGVVWSVDYFVNDVLKPHQQNRIKALINPEADPLGYGWNVTQSKIAIGSGGLLGKGYLQGTQTKFDFVPEQSTDFIFCTLG
ncbi:MAG: M50 family metallopeptidase, partial [Cyclobacteriaceae bacterium]|nr:M50 family metallopeptidase [Cyclobacteriaceae bacterium]